VEAFDCPLNFMTGTKKKDATRPPTSNPGRDARHWLWILSRP
jgi:hypothetical protein